MDIHTLADWIAYVAIAFIAWQFKLIFDMKIKQVKLETELFGMKEDMNKGSARFDNIETELKGIRKDITELTTVIRNSIWRGIDAENPRLPD